MFGLLDHLCVDRWAHMQQTCVHQLSQTTVHQVRVVFLFWRVVRVYFAHGTRARYSALKSCARNARKHSNASSVAIAKSTTTNSKRKRTKCGLCACSWWFAHLTVCSVCSVCSFFFSRFSFGSQEADVVDGMFVTHCFWTFYFTK